MGKASRSSIGKGSDESRDYIRLSDMIFSFAGRQSRFVLQQFQLLRRNTRVDHMKPGIDAERNLQLIFGQRILPNCLAIMPA